MGFTRSFYFSFVWLYGLQIEEEDTGEAQNNVNNNGGCQPLIKAKLQHHHAN
jgi:hypothetical protein